MKTNTSGSIRFVIPILLFLPALSLFAGCARKPVVDPVAHKQQIEEWQKQRHARITSESGWLTLCGLFWLIEGENSVGSDSSSMILLPKGKAPGKLGSIHLDNDGSTRFTAAKGADVRVGDSAITDIVLRNDQDPSGDATILRTGTISFYVIKRADQIGVRVKDSQNPARVNFKGLEYFPIDARWATLATFQPYTPPKELKTTSVIGTVETDSCPGALVFELEGHEYRLDVVIEQGSDNQFFIMFADQTSGTETYTNGRQLYTELPDKDNHVVLDFNKAFNWPCVFTPYATCPLPPKQNILPLRIEAGEKMYREGH